jgi:hypothetical protein
MSFVSLDNGIEPRQRGLGLGGLTNEVVPMHSLSLEPSTNKLARAESHLRTLQLKLTETPDMEAFELTSGPPDSDRWITVTLVAKELGIPELALIAGHFIHNLRAALDYVISAAVDTVPGLVLTIRHQFPICTSENAFRKKVVTATNRPQVNGDTRHAGASRSCSAAVQQPRRHRLTHP